MVSKTEITVLTNKGGQVLEKQGGFFSLKAILKSLIIILMIISFAGWYFGFTPDDVGDFFKIVSTIHKPEMPITVKYRPSILGKGYVVLIQNHADKDLTFRIKIRSTSRNLTNKNKYVNIKSQDDISIGWLEGWDFQLGDKILISHEKYRADLYIIKPN